MNIVQITLRKLKRRENQERRRGNVKRLCCFSDSLLDTSGGIDWHWNSVLQCWGFLSSWASNRFSGGAIGTKIFGIIGVLILLPLWLPVAWPSSGKLKNFTSQTFLLQKYVTWNCDTLQKYSVHKIEELVRFEFSNFILWRHNWLRPKLPFWSCTVLIQKKWNEFETTTYDKYKSENLNWLSFIG